MIAKLQIYQCAHCGNIVEVVYAGGGKLVCCGEPMTLVTENAVDASQEKHVPVLAKTANGYQVTVGSVLHPMEEKHYIEWIELIADNKAYRHFLNPGAAPEAVFNITAAKVTARAYCNLHGLWKSEA
jgi:superoxide reductase